jgi:hypothetical protein
VEGGFIAYQKGGTGDRVCTPDFEVDGDEMVPKVA